MSQVTWAILVACGKNEQMTSGVDVPFLDLGGKPVLTYSLQAFEHCPDIAGVVVVADKDRRERVLGIAQLFGYAKVRRIVHGASHHMATVHAALKVLAEEVTMVVVHSASRPCVTGALLSETIKAAAKDGAAAAGVPLDEVLKEVGKSGLIKGRVETDALWIAQSPQAYRLDLLNKAYAAAGKKKKNFEDDTEALAFIGRDVRLVNARRPNFRIRTPDDLMMAVSLLS